MVSSRKRNRNEMEAPEPPKELSALQRIRNLWEFANLGQWIFTFGAAVKIDEDFGIEELEMECLKPTSAKLSEIGLAILKMVSSHRGLTPEIFDEYARRQFVAKAPERNPFGEEEDPQKFDEFDTITKIRVLQQLTQWTFVNPDRLRERMPEQKDSEQSIWRIEPYGWDSDDHTYFVLDDDRLYRRTDPPPPPPPAPKPKKNSKKAKAASRASKRRKISEPVESEADPTEDDNDETQLIEEKKPEYDGLGGMAWECVAVGLEDYNEFLASIKKSRDKNEKLLHEAIVDNVLPLLEKREEDRKRRQAQKERELLNLEKLATAKRSSRIAGKMEMQKQEQEAKDEQRRKEAELVMAKKEQEKWQKLEQERESRMMTREQRLKEREVRRILHEEELANLSEDSKKIGTGEARLSERHLKAEMERKKQAIEELTEEEDWVFDCICGANGQVDDGTHSIACDKCNVWQHSKCVGVDEKEADKNKDFLFICQTCKRRAQDAERAKTHPPIKIKINRPGSSTPAAAKQSTDSTTTIKVNGAHQPQSSPKQSVQGTGLPPLHSFAPPNLQSSPPFHQAPSPQKPVQPRAYPSAAQYSSNQAASQIPSSSSPIRPPSSSHQGPRGPYQSSGPPISPFVASHASSSHAFSSPNAHSPTSLPPSMAQSYTFVNGNGQNHQAIQNQSSSIVPTATPSAAQPQPQFANGMTPASNSQRRSSFNLPSPLSATPVLAPATHNGTNTPFGSVAPKTSPPQSSAALPAQTPSMQQNGHDQASMLPSSMTGISPTKHSPPRPTTSNGSFGSATPSVLPPVASLSPSPRLQDPTPPIKLTDSERTKSNGHGVTS